MKVLLPFLAVAFLSTLSGLAADEPKPLVSVSAKRHTLDSDHELRGRLGNTGRKVVTLRVEITNTSSAPVEASVLSGDALVLRALGESEKLVKESLGKVQIPELKPNEKKTVELGKITLSEVEWAKKKFEESLEEWKITCTQGQVIIGGTESSDMYAELEGTARTGGDKGVPPGLGKKPGKRKFR